MVATLESDFATAFARLYPDLWPAVPQFRFDPARKWTFDFAWPDQRVAVEIQGLTRTGIGRHQRVKGYTDDCRKLNAATALGWRVLWFTQLDLAKGPGGGMLAETCRLVAEMLTVTGSPARIAD